MRLIHKIIFIIIYPIYITVGLLMEILHMGLSALEKRSNFLRDQGVAEQLGGWLKYFSRKTNRLWGRSPINQRNPIERIFDKRPEPYPSRDRQTTTEKLLFGERTVIYYYEPRPNAVIRDVIERRMAEIIHRMKARSVDYFDLNALKQLTKETNQAAAQYYLPIGENLLKDLADNIQRKFTHRQFCEILGIDAPEGPCFIKCSPEKHEGKYICKLYFLPESDTASIESSIDYYLHFISGHPSGLQYSKGSRVISKPGTDPDNDHEDADRELNRQLEVIIKAELDRNGENGLVKMITYMCEYLTTDNTNITQELKQLTDAYTQRTRPSRLFIRRNGVIQLLDYGKEVCLNPLQLTVYLFFIQRPEGIMFKELPKYRDELYRIYSILTNRGDRATIAKSIDDLANPFSNSMSEKCSRIKEAFLRVVDERWAEPYYINGGRNEPKRIMLSRDLIELEGDI